VLRYAAEAVREGGDALPRDHRSDRRRADLSGAADFDLELIENRTLDGHIRELVYRPTLHV
jgi:hypothetical protein